MFDVAAEAYDDYMGRYSAQLTGPLVRLAGVAAGQRALDVGCGPGALLEVLVDRLGPEAVAGVDPSESFVVAARNRHPGVDVRLASADRLPFADSTFDAALAQLVVHLLPDPVAGLREMGRVTRSGGVVAACVWDYAGDRGPVSTLWQAARELNRDVVDESDLPGVSEGQLADLFAAAGLRELTEETHEADREFTSFDDWWSTYMHGVGPAGAFVTGLEVDARAELREQCRERLPDYPLTVRAQAWAVRGVVDTT